MSEAVELPKKNRRGCKIGCGIVGALFLGVILFFGKPACDLLKHFDIIPPPKHEYSATSEENLKALYQAMSMYHDSEGQYPEANGWMDAISNRLKTNDLQKGEEMKKLVRPDLLEQDGKYGYAMNDAASAKYKDDIKDPAKTPLLFESKTTEKNAHGDPKESRIGMAITVDGTILKQP